MAETTVNLGMLPQNRGEYSSSATYYKDNIVQYNGSSYICTAAMDLEHPSGITGVAPYDSDPATPNTGWAVFSNDSSGVGEGVYNVSVDHTTDNQQKVYASLSAALLDVPQAKKKGGMEIRFIFNNSDYAVDKEEGITTQPAGTLITSSPTMVDGTYKASQLLAYFSTLPTAIGAGNAVVYYKEVDGTYTTWTITLQSSDNKYVQYRLMSDEFTTDVAQWQGVDEELTYNSNNLAKSGDAFELKRDISSISETVECYNKTVEISGTETGTVINFGTETFYANKGDLLIVNISGLANVASAINVWINGNGQSRNFVDGETEYTLLSDCNSVRFGIKTTNLTGNSGTVIVTATRKSQIDIKIDELHETINNDINYVNDKISISDDIIKHVNDKISVLHYKGAPGHIDSGEIVSGGEHLMIPLNVSMSVIKIVVGTSAKIQYAFINSYNPVTGSIVFADNADLITTGNIEYLVIDLTQKPSNSNYLYIYRSSKLVNDVLIDGVSINDTISVFSQVLNQNTDKILLDVTKLPTNGQNARLQNTYIPKGSTIRITVVGLGTAISEYYYVIDGGVEHHYAQAVVDVELVEDLSVLSLRTRTENIIDGTKNVTWKVELVSVKTVINKKYDEPLTATDNLFDPYDEECKDKFTIKDSNGTIEYNSSYWVSGFIPVDSTKGKLICKRGLFKAAFYDNSKAFISIETTLNNLSIIDIPATAFYIRLSFSIPYDDRNTVRLFYRYTGKCIHTQKSIDANKITIKDNQYFTLADILKFSSDVYTHEFTSNFGVWVNEGNLANLNMILSCRAKYVTNDDSIYPKIRYYIRRSTGALTSSNVFYESCYYEIGGNGEYEEKEWRIPPVIEGAVINITVSIPSGVTLYIDKFENYYSDKKGILNPAYRADGHVAEYARFCTKDSFYYAAKLGYPCCITVPKRTSDGVWVCFHDESIGEQLIDSNGDTPQEKYGVNAISGLTYAQLQEFTYNETKRGYKDKVPTLEYFFLYCAKTGMEPMLSVHPTPTESEYIELKALATRIGVLRQLNLKPLVGGTTAPAVHTAFNIMGNDIGGYIIQAHGGPSLSTIISAVSDINVDKSKVRWGIEFYGNEITLENVNTARNAGFLVSCTHVSSQTGKDMEYWMKNGVTEWTEDKNCSYGLNW